MNNSNGITPFYTASTFRFITFNIVSFDLYTLYWLFKNWKKLIISNNLNMNPYWRTFFAPIFFFSFGINVKYELSKCDLKQKWNPIVLGILYIGLNALYKLPDPFWLLSGLSFIPPLIINNSLREINIKNGFSEITSGKLTIWQMIILVFCYILYFLCVTGAFLLAMKNR